MAALSSTLVWEVRTTGNSANGGAFRAGATGTDYSQQDTAQVSYTDLTVDATTNTIVTSASTPFTSAHVGNVINISSGSPWTAGYYEIMSVTSGAATLNASPAATSSTGGVGKLGGAVDHPSTIASKVVASNIVWVKSGTYSVSSAISFTAALSPPTNASPATRLSGYSTTRGDTGRALLSSNGFFGTVLTTGAGWYVSNFEINTNNSRIGITVGQYSTVYNCKIYGAIVFGINIQNANCVSFGNEVYGCSGTNALAHGGYSICWGNYVHDNTTTGISITFNSVVSWNLVVNNTGSTSDGINIGGALAETVVTHNTIHGNGRHGLNFSVMTQYVPQPVQNNILSYNGGWGVIFASAAGIPAMPMFDGNVYCNNTSGTRSNGNDTTVNVQNNSAPYINVLDKVITVNPYVDSANNDFRLNSRVDGGLLCRGSGSPLTIIGIANGVDMGVLQSKATTRQIGFNGGYNS
jgi:hypothetical protein